MQRRMDAMSPNGPSFLARALAVVFLAATPLASARAQDSLNVQPPAGAAVVVIIPDSLDGAPRTVSELLRDRAPSASVRRSTGAIGASAFVSFRDASALGGDPLVVIDGIRQVHARLSLDTLDRRSPSVLDDIMVEDVARIEILPGPAAAASYGSDGQRGAIVITTRARGRGGPAFSASMVTSGSDGSADFARNLTRATASGYACPYFMEVAGSCTATATTRYTPLVDRTPFRSAQQLRAHLGATGGVGRLGYAAALGFERGSGTMQTDAADRTVARLRLQLPVSSIVRVGLSSYANGRGITYPAQGDYSVLGAGVGGGPLDCSPATPCGRDSSSGGYRYPLSWLEQGQPHRRIRHLGSALTMDVEPLPRLSLRTSVTGDMFRDLESLRDSSPPGYMATLTEVTANERSWRVDGAQEARFTASIAGAAATTLLAVRFDADRGRSSSRTSMVAGLANQYPGQTMSVSTTEGWVFRDRFSQSLDQRLAWGDRAALGIGVRRTTTDVNRGPRLHPILDLHGDGMYQLVPTATPLGILQSVRLRTAWGRTGSLDLGNVPAGLAYMSTPYGGYAYGGSAGPRPRRPADQSSELEAGIDAAFTAASSRLSITAFRRDDRLDYLGMIGAGDPAARKITGGELLAEATPVDLPAARLHLRGQLAVSHDRVGLGNTSPITIASGPAVYLAIANGASWGAWLTQPANWSDANGNGRIERDEISYPAATVRGRSRPSSIASLSGDLEIPRSFTISAVLDHAGGFDVYDAASAQQCWRLVCPALNDPNASIDQQGRAVAVASAFHAAGFVVPGDATTLRELSLAWHSSRAASAFHAATLGVTLSAYDLARWSRSSGSHPETDMPAPGAGTNLWKIVQPIPRSFALRVALDY